MASSENTKIRESAGVLVESCSLPRNSPRLEVLLAVFFRKSGIEGIGLWQGMSSVIPTQSSDTRHEFSPLVIDDEILEELFRFVRKERTNKRTASPS